MSAAMTQIRREKQKKKRVWESYFNSQSGRQPCPACGHVINSSADTGFEIQQMIPRGFGADDMGEEWNMFPLCSNKGEDGEDGEDGDCGWGCSELLEREQCIAVEDLEDAAAATALDTSADSADDKPPSANALDWLVSYYPRRVHEILMRLQRAHGEAFGFPAGDTLCLRFARDMFQEGKNQFDGNAFCADRTGEWKRRGVGFKSDIMDLAECLKECTDAEMLRRIELKDMITPKKHHNRSSANANAQRTPCAESAAGEESPEGLSRLVPMQPMQPLPKLMLVPTAPLGGAAPAPAPASAAASSAAEPAVAVPPSTPTTVSWKEFTRDENSTPEVNSAAVGGEVQDFY
jgi:hypothetical protein